MGISAFHLQYHDLHGHDLSSEKPLCSGSKLEGLRVRSQFRRRGHGGSVSAAAVRGLMNRPWSCNLLYVWPVPYGWDWRFPTGFPSRTLSRQLSFFSATFCPILSMTIARTI
ncbi:hypothetical protein BDW68DRAFT_171102 [Aspergillus falconensis]